MKTIISILLFHFFCGIASAQETKPKSNNLLDMEANYYMDILGDSLNLGKDPNEINGFKEMVDESQDLTPQQKEAAKRKYDELNKNAVEIEKKNTHKSKDSI